MSILTIPSTLLTVVSSCLFIIIAESIFAQNGGGEVSAFGDEVDNYQCIDPDEIAIVENLIKLKNAQLDKDQLSRNMAKVNLEFPLRYVDSLNIDQYYGIVNFVDRDPSTRIQDYNCGTRSYDGHKGTDYSLWPTPWLLQERNSVEVIAAAPGEIIRKIDGNYDKQCAWNDNVQWNAIYILHEDGTSAWYGHLKENSLTTKKVGDSVSTGEYLGIVASSGRSSGPHLHFELRDARANVLDPYSGECHFNTQGSLWQNQEPYSIPSVNAIITSDERPNAGCHNVENISITDDFETTDDFYVAFYLRDQQRGHQFTFEIKDPNEKVFSERRKLFNNTYSLSYWYWGFNLPKDGPFGTWTIDMHYRDSVFTKTFEYNAVVTSSNNLREIELNIYPNPTFDKLYIEAVEGTIEVLELYDSKGAIVESLNPNKDVSMGHLSSGLYFLYAKTTDGHSGYKKIVKLD